MHTRTATAVFIDGPLRGYRETVPAARVVPARVVELDVPELDEATSTLRLRGWRYALGQFTEVPDDDVWPYQSLGPAALDE